MKKILLLLLLVAQGAFAQNINGSWHGVLEAGPQKLNLIFDIDKAANTVKLSVIEQGIKGLPMEVAYLSDDSVSVSLAQSGLNYQGRLRGDELQGQFHQGMFSAALNCKKGNIELNRPQEPKPPFPYTTEEVTFNNGNVAKLAGTLCYPVGYKQGQRVPVVLFVTGSGPEDRNQELFGHKSFLVVADWLARHGVASLRYDDRGIGGSTGDVKNATTYDFAKDAAAGIDYLRSLKRFSKVGLIGCSEGGGIGYMLAADNKLDFLVSWCGPACKSDTMMVLQLNALIAAQGGPANSVKTAADARKVLLQQRDDAWTRCMVDLDFTPYVKKTHCPVLALFGKKDVNVPAAMNEASLKTNLPKNDKNKIKVYPGLNHLLQHCKYGPITESLNIEETISPEVLQDMSDWIKGL
jgi:pimeloyl-ACP methyl ester carboxylesterase